MLAIRESQKKPLDVLFDVERDEFLLGKDEFQGSDAIGRRGTGRLQSSNEEVAGLDAWEKGRCFRGNDEFLVGEK